MLYEHYREHHNDVEFVIYLRQLDDKQTAGNYRAIHFQRTTEQIHTKCDDREVIVGLFPKPSIRYKRKLIPPETSVPDTETDIPGEEISGN